MIIPIDLENVEKYVRWYILHAIILNLVKFWNE